MTDLRFTDTNEAVIKAGIGRSDRDTAFYDPADDQTVAAKKKDLEARE